MSFTYVGDSFCFLMKSSFLLFGVTMRDLVDFVLEIISVKRLTVSVVMNSWRSRCWWTKWWWHHTWGPRKTLHSCRRKSATGLFKLKAHFAGNHTFQAFRMHTASCLSKHRTALKLRFCVKVLLASLIDEIKFYCAGPLQIPWEHPTLHRREFVARPLCSLGPLVTVKRLVNAESCFRTIFGCLANVCNGQVIYDSF